MATEEEIRAQAIEAIKQRRAFWSHVVAYCVVNIFFIVIWYLNGRGYFWPGWTMAAWAVAVAFHAWNVFGRGQKVISEDEIQREVERQKRG